MVATLMLLRTISVSYLLMNGKNFFCDPFFLYDAIFKTMRHT